MAKNVQGVIFLRNGNLYPNRNAALAVLSGNTLLNRLNDGEMALARYGSGSNVKTLAGMMYKNGVNKSITVIDVEGASEDVQELREQMEATFGSGVTTANTATAQLAALRGGAFVPGTSSSANTSVEGAKAYAYDLVGTLDGGVTAETGYFVKSVSEVDGKISGTTEALPSYNDEAVAKKFVIAVDETNGKIAVTRGEVTSTDKTVKLTDGADGGINLAVNIDNSTIVKDANTGVISVASAALTQYVGDENTIEVSAVDPTDNTKTISSLLTITKVTTGLSEEVKEEYHLVGSNGNTIGEPVKIYKDSHIVSINYIDDPTDPNYQKLEYVYVNASGVTSTTYVNMSELVLEAEFASGLTIENHVARGVVDPQSEKDSQGTPVNFLTVGANGFKVSGIKNEIDRKIGELNATQDGHDTHVEVIVTQAAGKIIGVQVKEDNIADADDLAALSAKTVTEIGSSNASISAVSAASTDGTVKYDIVTDADKIKMSGFSADDNTALSGIAESDSIATAFEKTNTVITENERVTAAALNDLDGRLDTIEPIYLSGVSVNGNAVTVTDHVAPILIKAATSTPTGTITDPAIIVNNNASTGEVTLGIGYIDCGTYD